MAEAARIPRAAAGTTVPTPNYSTVREAFGVIGAGNLTKRTPNGQQLRWLCVEREERPVAMHDSLICRRILRV
jgi:hypothetical protein